MKCSLCHARKGKRNCPAVRALICPSCCGEKRLVEVACPADCSWLAEGIRHDILKDFQDYSKRQAPAQVRRFASALQGLLPLLELIEQAVVDTAGAARDLTDGEVIEALDSLHQGYSSEAGGIVWQPHALSPRVEMLIRSARNGVDSLRDAVGKAGRGEIPAPAIVEALGVERERAMFHRDGPASTRFVRLLRRTRPPFAPSDPGRPAAPGAPRMSAAKPAGIVLAE